MVLLYVGHEDGPSYISYAVNLLLKSIDRIENGLEVRKWDTVANAFGEAAENLLKLDDRAAVGLHNYIIEPAERGGDVKDKLGAFMPKEKEEQDGELVDSYLKMAEGKTEEEVYDEYKTIVQKRNEWSAILMREIDNYKQKGVKREGV
ncbi:uncharacterized protein [Blastocystis hominis]|uniref:Uncharacterized protein n=1 Tax=Blastocystis hominis TaxID=12968 RepID=D8MAI4_BLAHO|nr:uncharacterized protein [Blastocystis hominis]CBK25073.2 unnamed protein product [Blastocystis hominis]|eukprot:XP_012899121.1 uncharacterized protein [Blastocystis hominis]